jgi:hypothetical protein
MEHLPLSVEAFVRSLQNLFRHTTGATLFKLVEPRTVERCNYTTMISPQDRSIIDLSELSLGSSTLYLLLVLQSCIYDLFCISSLQPLIYL